MQQQKANAAFNQNECHNKFKKTNKDGLYVVAYDKASRKCNVANFTSNATKDRIISGLWPELQADQQNLSNVAPRTRNSPGKVQEKQCSSGNQKAAAMLH